MRDPRLYEAGLTDRRLSRDRRALVTFAGVALLLTIEVSPGTEAPDDPPSSALPPQTLRACEIDSGIETPARRSERVLLGLTAYTCGATAHAADLLELEPDPQDALEDWRLFVLAEAATESDDLALAAAATDLLLLDHGASPLRHRSFALRARIAHLAGEHDRALSMARASRAASFPEELRTELDVLAWKVASELGRSVDIRQEARQLLLHAPLEALDLEVAEALKAPDGNVPWSEHFRPWELLLRASRLLEAGLLEEAIETLDAVAPDDRDLDWHLIKASALIEDRRGVEALEVLHDVAPSDAASELEKTWLQAEAALDAATARRGRQNLPSSQRDEMRQTARNRLRYVVQQGGDSARVLDALKRLFEELADGEHFEEVMEILQRLRFVDPQDATGERYLWQLGWSEYKQRNYSGAVGYWSELMELYPDRKLSRSAHYWSGRSHEALGNPGRARTILEQVASATATDYYRKHALIRLGREAEASDAAPRVTPQPWPSDPLLARAEHLSDLGVDQLGLEELELLAQLADRRAADALRSRILARQGHRRESIQNLWRVFPVLGTPEQASVPDDALRMYYPVDFLSIVERFAADNRLPVTILLAMIRQESAFDVHARSWAGAQGLMQVMPATARELAQKMGLPYSRDRLNEPSFSVQLGSRYFRQVLDMFDDNLELALAAYNAGPYRIRKLVQSAGPDLEFDSFLEGLSIEESKTYVKRVVLFSNSYGQLYPGLG